MFNLLVSTVSLLEDAEGGKGAPAQKWLIWVILGVVVVLLFAWFFFSSRKNKQKQKEYVEQLDAIAPGNKVKTAGGICGIVVEVCDDNTVIIKTGSEDSGYSFVKMEKELIAQTDAKGATQLAREAAEEKKRLEKEGVKTDEPAAPLEEIKEVAEIKTAEDKSGDEPAPETTDTADDKAEDKAEEKAED